MRTSNVIPNETELERMVRWIVNDNNDATTTTSNNNNNDYDESCEERLKSNIQLARKVRTYIESDESNENNNSDTK